MRLRSVGISLLAVPLALAVGCGGGSSPEDEIAGIAQDHSVAIGEFNAAGICGPMGSEAEEEYADAGDEVEGWTTATESAFCEYLVENSRENFDDLDGPEKEAANQAAEALRGVEMENSVIDPDGISAMVTSKPFTLEFAGEQQTLQLWYSMTKEDGTWLVNEAVIFEEGSDPEEDGTEIFPDP